MHILKYGILIFLCPVLSTFGQSPLHISRVVQIGDKVPAITITNIYNYPASSVKLQGLKGKLVILDFWSTWCSACIESFPKMHRLQSAFGDSLQIFLVDTYSGDDIKKVKPFFERRASVTGEKVILPFSLLQASLADYFPYKYVPHYVWISPQGRIIAVTSQFEVTAVNISEALKGNTASIHMKRDVLDFDNRRPLFVNGNGGTGSDFLYRSVFSNYIEGLGTVTGATRTADGRITRIYFMNTDVLTLLRTAYAGKLELPSSKIIIEAKDGNKYSYGASDDTMMYKNSYCYDVSVPPASLEQIQHFMQEDIYRVFHVRVKREERNMTCMLLSENEKAGTVYTTGGTPDTDMDKHSSHKFIRNQPVNILTDILNDHPALKGMPVIDEGLISHHIDIEFPTDFYDMDLQALITFLANLGLGLGKAERKIEVAVITDK